MNEIQIVKYTFKYVVLNKPSGIQCNGSNNYKVSLLLQLAYKFKQLGGSTQTSSKQFQLVQRLDKYVTGGLVVSRDPKFTKRLNSTLRNEDLSYKLVRRYVGLIPFRDDLPFHEQLSEFRELNDDKPYKGLTFDDRSYTKGTITYDVQALQTDENISPKVTNTPTARKIVNHPAETKFKLLHNLKYYPSKGLKSKYPELFKSKIIYPIIYELHTGCKNQIRDHTLKAFKIPLLNDDKFQHFKYILQSKEMNVNSEIFKSNQIGLHSGYLNLSNEGGTKESLLFPLSSTGDRELWDGIVDSDSGLFHPNVEDALLSF